MERKKGGRGGGRKRVTARNRQEDKTRETKRDSGVDKRREKRGRENEPKSTTRGDGISHCKVFQATAAKDDRKDREEDTDMRGKTKWEQVRERKGVSVDGRLLRLCSRSFPLNSSTSGGGDSYTRRTRGCGRMESQDDAESDGGGGGGGNGRDPCDEKGVQERATKHYAGWHDCIEMLEREIERKRENGRGRER